MLVTKRRNRSRRGTPPSMFVSCIRARRSPVPASGCGHHLRNASRGRWTEHESFPSLRKSGELITKSQLSQVMQILNPKSPSSRTPSLPDHQSYREIAGRAKLVASKIPRPPLVALVHAHPHAHPVAHVEVFRIFRRYRIALPPCAIDPLPLFRLIVHTGLVSSECIEARANESVLCPK